MRSDTLAPAGSPPLRTRARPAGLDRWLRRLEVVLRLVGVACLSLCALVVAEQHLARVDAELDLARSRLVAENWSVHAPSAEALAPTRPGVGDPVGRLEIPRLGVAAAVLHGTDDDTLRRAVGHFEHAPLPGGAGNVALAGHRDADFAALRDIAAGDLIHFETANGRFTYRVTSLDVVEPERFDVVEDHGVDELTLVTCYPFGYLGAAPQRFVVHARAVGPATEASEIAALY